MVNGAKLIKETLLQKYIGEKQLLKSEQVVKNLTENMGSAFAAFADVSLSHLSWSFKKYQLSKAYNLVDYFRFRHWSS